MSALTSPCVVRECSTSTATKSLGRLACANSGPLFECFERSPKRVQMKLHARIGSKRRECSQEMPKVHEILGALGDVRPIHAGNHFHRRENVWTHGLDAINYFGGRQPPSLAYVHEMATGLLRGLVQTKSSTVRRPSNTDRDVKLAVQGVTDCFRKIDGIKRKNVDVFGHARWPHVGVECLRSVDGRIWSRAKNRKAENSENARGASLMMCERRVR